MEDEQRGPRPPDLIDDAVTQAVLDALRAHDTGEPVHLVNLANDTMRAATRLRGAIAAVKAEAVSRMYERAGSWAAVGIELGVTGERAKQIARGKPDRR